MEYVEQDWQNVDKWQIHGGLLYYCLPTFVLENSNTQIKDE